MIPESAIIMLCWAGAGLLGVLALIQVAARATGARAQLLYTILDSLAAAARLNMPLHVALQALAEDCPWRWRRRLTLAGLRAAEGAPIGEALECLGAALPRAYTTIISSCERRGALADMLEAFARDQRLRAEARRRAIYAAMYPSMLFFVLATYGGLFCGFIAPKYIAMFTEQGIPLPVISQLVLNAGKMSLPHFELFVLGCVGVFMSASLVYFMFVYRWPSAAFSAPLDALVFSLPGLRRFLLWRSLTHFSRALASVLNAGLPLPDALDAAAEADLIWPVRRRIAQAARRVQQGAALADSLREAGLFPSNFVWLLGLGEESGQLAEACEHAAEAYQNRSEQWVRRAAALLFPSSILAVGCLEAFFVFGLFLPIIDLSRSLM